MKFKAGDTVEIINDCCCGAGKNGEIYKVIRYEKAHENLKGSWNLDEPGYIIKKIKGSLKGLEQAACRKCLKLVKT